MRLDLSRLDGFRGQLVAEFEAVVASIPPGDKVGRVRLDLSRLDGFRGQLVAEFEAVVAVDPSR
ncbi:hypothetical protein [Dactylosporangium sp. NPDC051541]|uniref:hypothetical protein n=1 Tax=Dactylosporangium sp. NPDC051541 TaxID=3363977 RepID=UPI0037920150